MKKRILILSLVVASLSILFTGCKDYLDSDYLFDERMTVEDIFSNKDYTNRWLAECYAYLGNNHMQDICSKIMCLSISLMICTMVMAVMKTGNMEGTMKLV